MELLKLQNKLTPTFITKQIGTLSFFTMRIRYSLNGKSVADFNQN